MPRRFKTKQDKEQKRFYLLPGQGGKAYHRKQKFILQCALIVGLLVSAFLALAIYWMHHSAH